jgi:integrase/recombinase XerD
MDKTIFLKPVFHKGENRLILKFPHNPELISIVKSLGNARWSQTHKAWHIPNSDNSFNALQKAIEEKAKLVRDTLEISIVREKLPDRKEPCLSQEVIVKIEKYRQWMVSRRYSENTIKTYMDGLRSFLKFFSHKRLTDITNDDIILYNNDYIIRNNLSASYQNQVINAIKLFFSKIENALIDVDIIHRPKRSKVLPNVLSKEEIKLILSSHSNIKHKAMLSLIYSCGLRRSELLNLKLNDIDSKRGLVIIRQAKGKKDRIAPLSEKILEILRDYYKAYKPKFYLFEGQNKQSPYDERSLVSVLKQALEKSKIRKPVTLHWLRHSYATHLLENGTDLRYIQEILGHNSSRTTEIYTHVSNKSIQKVISPFDNL